DVALPGEDDEGRRAAAAERLAQELEAGALAQAVVEQIHVVPGLFDRLQALLERRDPVDLVTGAPRLAQQMLGERVLRLAVVDQQNPDGLWLHQLRSVSWAAEARASPHD